MALNSTHRVPVPADYIGFHISLTEPARPKVDAALPLCDQPTMDPSNRTAKRADTERKWPSPTVLTFWTIVLLNLFMANLAFGGYSPSVGGDAAGNAMSSAFDKLFMIAALGLIGLLSILFLLVRRQWFRITLIVVLGMNIFLLLTILSLQY